MKQLLLLSTSLLLSGCFAGAMDFAEPPQPQNWTAHQTQIIQTASVQDLKNWWQGFEDPTLNTLIERSLQDSPDRKIAEARILEARGIRRTTRSSLFPQINGSASTGREKTTQYDADDFYDAGFDASYEIDIFGKNRSTDAAAKANINALEAGYHDVTLSLIAEVTRTYINLRAFEKQVAIAQKNLDIQLQTLKLIRDQQKFGEAPQLDVDRAETLVNTTRASIPEFKRQAENARLQLTVLTGTLPAELLPILQQPADIPGANLRPVLMAPAEVLALRPDIRAASYTLTSSTELAEAATAEFFPSFTIGGFFGVSDNALVSAATIWNVVAGAAVALLDFGRIEGAIDAARAVEMRAYQNYRKTTLEAVTEVETALNDYAHINEQRIALQKAFNSAQRSLNLSQTLYKEGEISFLDVLDSQRTLNEADSNLITAEAAQAESLVRLYKSLGVY